MYVILIFLAISAAPLQQAFAIPEPFPVRLATDILTILALPAFAFRRRDSDMRRRTGTDATLVLMLMVLILTTGVLAAYTNPGSQSIRQYIGSAEFDLFWFTTRALIVLSLWFVGRSIPSRILLKAFAVATWVMFVGVVAQQTLKLAGMDSVLSSLGFSTRTSGIYLDGASASITRSGTFPNGQELGFFAGAMVFAMLWSRRHVLASLAAYCLVYSLSTTGFIGVGLGFAVLVVVSRSLRARVVSLVAVATAVVAVSASSYLRALLDFQLAKVGLADSDIAQAGQSLEIRGIKTDIAVQMMWDNPLFGVGASRFGNHAGEYTEAGLVPPRTLVTVENGYAQLGAEHGLFALVVFGLLLACLAFTAWRLRRDFELALLLFLSVAIGTQSMWTQTAIWLLLATVGSSMLEHGTGDRLAPGRMGPAGYFSHQPHRYRPRLSLASPSHARRDASRDASPFPSGA